MWIRWIIIVAAATVAGWMAFDGTRALIVGDYVTPKSGRYAGQLGPWSKLVSAVGIEPRSTTMKSLFAVLGFAWLAAIVCFALKLPWAQTAMLVFAVGSLWYLPFGTLLGIVQIVLLLVSRMRGGI
ncbi:MAG TPA: hypothetical protein VGB22_00305 [candidate division Zixibacteria bacterium]|jgi:hypothetical protein